MESNEQTTVAAVRFSKVGKLYYFDYSRFPDLQPGDYVIVDTSRGRYMGQVMGFVPVDESIPEYRTILRPATPRDMLLSQKWKEKEADALAVCEKKSRKFGGYHNVKFIAAQYNYDGTSLAFLFTAEQKVNVVPLWNELKREFAAQIEMRQISPRDVAKLMGGLGACSELRCCSTFLTDFSPISIKMAKVQDISLNPSEITGMCGRLRCCLVYEYEQYLEARAQLPRRNKRVGTPHGIGRVVDLYPLQDAVSVFVEEQGMFMVPRERLLPLSEYEALLKKAQSPCDESCAEGQEESRLYPDQRLDKPVPEAQPHDAPVAVEETQHRRRRSKPRSQDAAAHDKQDKPETSDRSSRSSRDRRGRSSRRRRQSKSKNQNE